MKTGAIIVLYNPDIALLGQLIDALTKQADVLCLVDNSPTPLEVGTQPHQAHYLHFPENIGIAAAQNRGLQLLCEQGCIRALLLDQDSEICDQFIHGLNQAFDQALEHENNVIAVGPQVICAFTNQALTPRFQQEREITAGLVSTPQMIASGMLLDVGRLQETGFKDATLFIDGVDHEWCWRARNQGWAIAISKRVTMKHRIGDDRLNLAGLAVKVGAPVRLYYQFRNVLLLSRRGYVPGYWKFRNLSLLPLRFVVNAVLLGDRGERILYMVKGLWDGLCNRNGAYKQHWK